jgi:hypothetical protein
MLCLGVNSWRKILFEKSTVAQAVNKLQSYLTRRIITVYTTARHRFLSKDKWTQSTPSHIITLSVLMLSSNRWIGRPSSLLPIDFLIKTLYAYLVSHTSCLVHFILLWSHHPNNICKESYLCSSLCSFLQLSYLWPIIPISAMFWNTLGLCSSLRPQC